MLWRGKGDVRGDSSSWCAQNPRRSCYHTNIIPRSCKSTPSMQKWTDFSVLTDNPENRPWHWKRKLSCLVAMITQVLKAKHDPQLPCSDPAAAKGSEEKEPPAAPHGLADSTAGHQPIPSHPRAPRSLFLWLQSANEFWVHRGNGCAE